VSSRARATENATLVPAIATTPVRAPVLRPVRDLSADEPLHVPTGESLFPPIGDYAFLSDCENSCLVAPTGSIEWMSLPMPHDPSIFGTMLDRSAGSFRLAPADASVPAHRQYEPGTMVLSTTWQTRSGWLEVSDFLAVGPWYRTDGRSNLQRRTPGDFDARHMLVRTARCLHGSVDFVLSCEPSFDYGRVDAQWEYDGPSYEKVVTTNGGVPRLTLTGDMRFGIEGRAIRARHRLVEGESSFVVLGWTDQAQPETQEEVDLFQTETSRFWRGWIDGGRFPDHPWRELLQRSALTLKGLSFAPTGAILAAPTTSLPEHLGGSRNWDYRYTWIRDSAFALRALHALGFDTEADDFLAFLGDVLEPHGSPSERARNTLHVLYPVDGLESHAEVELGHLTGYAFSQPVRMGNGAYDQVQFDILGSVVDCIYEHTRSRDALSERSWRIVIQAVETAMQCWREPDRGIWEVRGEPCHFTYSKVMCWVALDRGARLAALRGDHRRAEHWSSEARAVHESICTNAVGKHGNFTQCYGSEELDASLLVLPMLGFLPAGDERVRATVFAIDDELTEGPYVYRYLPDSTDDGLEGEDEGTFTVCSFWLVSAFVAIGEVERARTYCEKLISSASALGLYGEEFDPTSARHLGNFPQALTHLALINAVLGVINAEQHVTGTARLHTWWEAEGKSDATNTIATSELWVEAETNEAP